jgi:uncharacterized protein (DUF433 family)
MRAMATSKSFVPTAEAAFIAGLTDRDMNRVIDENILPDVYFRTDNGRWFARLGAALASFYFGTEEQFVAGFRREILRSLTFRLESRADRDRLFALVQLPRDMDWHVEMAHTVIDATSFIRNAWERARKVERANALVQTKPDVMGGLEVFAGTRVTIETVLASLDRGVGIGRLQASYPFLTEEHVEAARIYAKVHPKRGRPRRLSDTHPEWKAKGTRVIRSAVKA